MRLIVLNVILLGLCLFVLGVYFFVVILTRMVCYSILSDLQINQFVNLFVSLLLCLQGKQPRSYQTVSYLKGVSVP